jgi:hypothetical protein
MSLTDWLIFVVTVIGMIFLVRWARSPTPPDASYESSDYTIPDLSDGNDHSSGYDNVHRD